MIRLAGFLNSHRMPLDITNQASVSSCASFQLYGEQRSGVGSGMDPSLSARLDVFRFRQYNSCTHSSCPPSFYLGLSISFDQLIHPSMHPSIGEGISSLFLHPIALLRLLLLPFLPPFLHIR